MTSPLLLLLLLLTFCAKVAKVQQLEEFSFLAVSCVIKAIFIDFTVEGGSYLSQSSSTSKVDGLHIVSLIS